MAPTSSKPEVLFICGSAAEAAQLHQVALRLVGTRAWFTPCYAGALAAVLRELGVVENTVLGRESNEDCLGYLRGHHLAIDLDGRRGRYGLVVMGTDGPIPDNAAEQPLVLVQSRFWNPDAGPLGWDRHFALRLSERFRRALGCPRVRVCVASDGYREQFTRLGMAATEVLVTGIPGHDDYACYDARENADLGYVLVCPADGRAVVRGSALRELLNRAVAVAEERAILVQLGRHARMRPIREALRRYVPHAVITTGVHTVELIARAHQVVSPWAAHVYAARALGKPVSGLRVRSDLERFAPVQNRSAAEQIAEVCRSMLTGHSLRESASAPPVAA